KIWLSLAKMSGKEIDFVKEAFDTNWVVPLGPNVNGFEKELEDFLAKENKVIALSSGTAALHLALIQLGVGMGDEVICQSFTFSASANPIKYVGANPVFIDSEVDTWNMNPKLLEEAICDRFKITGKYPKAIIPVHLYGMPAKMDEITIIADKYNIPILEDAAEALGSKYKTRMCGNFGDFGVLSFNGNKMITTSGGGALVCHSEVKTKETKYYATQARDDQPYYQHSKIGYNYRMSNICAGIGRGQMLVLDDFIARRKEINRLYRQYLNNITGIVFHTNPSEAYDSNYWLTCIMIDPLKAGFSNEELRLIMEKENIETRHLWKPMHLQPVFKDCPFYGSDVSEKLFSQGLCLPSSPVLSNHDIDRVINVIVKMKNKGK
ncbi:MAG: aminotransferase class V-fold PLP-dependent enzyme, partial [Candidatus Marinimicrobia bacterium]|nr:aminotransferase class V-fold PLP-dependent enzyme [Candidatus Neomarinimicrobiota bacterium]